MQADVVIVKGLGLFIPSQIMSCLWQRCLAVPAPHGRAAEIVACLFESKHAIPVCRTLPLDAVPVAAPLMQPWHMMLHAPQYVQPVSIWAKQNCGADAAETCHTAFLWVCLLGLQSTVSAPCCSQTDLCIQHASP